MDEDNSQSTEAEAPNDDQTLTEDTIVVHCQTTAGISIRPPSKYQDFQLHV
jgi:hypothetical protein